MEMTILCVVILPSEIVKKNIVEHYKYADEYLFSNINSVDTFYSDEAEYIKKFNRRPFNAYWIHKRENIMFLVRLP